MKGGADVFADRLSREGKTKSDGGGGAMTALAYDNFEGRLGNIEASLKALEARFIGQIAWVAQCDRDKDQRMTSLGSRLNALERPLATPTEPSPSVKNYINDWEKSALRDKIDRGSLPTEGDKTDPKFLVSKDSEPAVRMRDGRDTNPIHSIIHKKSGMEYAKTEGFTK